MDFKPTKIDISKAQIKHYKWGFQCHIVHDIVLYMDVNNIILYRKSMALNM